MTGSDRSDCCILERIQSNYQWMLVLVELRRGG